MRRAIALAALCAVLLAGCGRGVRRSDGGAQPAPSAPSAVTATTGGSDPSGGTATGGGATGTGQLDDQLKSVDGLLNELDNQVNGDGQAPPDAD